MSNETKNHDDYPKSNDGLPENKIASALFYVGWIMIGAGVLAGLFLGIDDSSYMTEFLPGIFFICVFSGLISGLTFIGFGEVIKQLFHLNIRLHRKGYSLLDKSESIEKENAS
ncbi:hypothetical protein [Ornithinibacillus sp. 179-J 7C1 HS]|uniref:hypothetical protein n=1 Tax=Ornithinibacillus sp. 179-J 7C1 HS TaxID=3142384 RepID=UPI0039A0B5E8